MYDFTNRFSNPQFLAALVALLAMLFSNEVNLNTLIWAATILFGTNQTPTEGLSDSGSNNTNPNPPATGSGGG